MSQPAIFYINLDTRTDRLEHIERELQRVGLVAERVRAVTSAEAAQVGSQRLTMPELACSLSHRVIWRHIVERGLPCALVLEDDAVLSDSLASAIERLARERRYDVVHLETLRANPSLGPALPVGDGVEIGRLLTSSPGTAAYMITRDFAAEMLARPDLDLYAVDAALFGRSSGVLYRSRVMQSVPALVVQLTELPGDHPGARSDLTQSRKVERVRDRRGFSGRISRLGEHLGHALRTLASFGVTGDLFRSRRVRIPIAEDILARFPPSDR